MKIGMRGLPTPNTPLLDFYELDALDTSFENRRSIAILRRRIGKSAEIVVTAGAYFCHAQDSIDLRERLTILGERAKAIEASTCVFIVPPSATRRPNLDGRLTELRKSVHAAGVTRVYFDLNLDSEVQPDVPRIGDPTWGSALREGPREFWRIHGYHPSRWVRMYSEQALRDLAHLARKRKPKHLSFAHSQRAIQSLVFRELYQSLG